MFVTFEGPEGAGKSTAVKFVAERLEREGHRVVCTREPGHGPLGKRIRELLLEGGELSSETELLLFLADRANHVAELIEPSLAAGQIVLCDRFADSTLVYQGFGRGLDHRFLREANEFATGGLKPDLTLLFDLPPEVGLSRISAKDRLDRAPLAFHEAVRAGFLTLAGEEPNRWVVIDAERQAEEVGQDAFRAVLSRIS